MDHNSSGGKALSSANKSLVSNCPEESGWTSYFEDLSKGIEPSYCSSLGGSSLVSDAASCAAWKFSHQNHGNGSSAPNLLKKLNFKKARAKQISEDDPLEDTASSPVNSPKVYICKVVGKIDDHLHGSMVKGFASSENYSELQTDDENDQVNLNGEKNDCTDLKKRGLCLVPMSMLVNYFG
ncbi:PREDICTED: uncharacterized protein LOC109353645 isoform X2 [Lupinus angustifolius]|uniref:uncharacterized protein LOC109353645 isoform X2 n=1 Tax=Lupinus angustifolius TaxID=3871 RepID=UPI00092FD46E|nr:PREDICTED: uncharacterized protein LOC109353645 isoform X2 [Lupinus angustifolius]